MRDCAAALINGRAAPTSRPVHRSMPKGELGRKIFIRTIAPPDALTRLPK
jgi:hypothetical protein